MGLSKMEAAILGALYEMEDRHPYPKGGTDMDGPPSDDEKLAIAKEYATKIWPTEAEVNYSVTFDNEIDEIAKQGAACMRTYLFVPECNDK